jgi:hypothetical protein
MFSIEALNQLLINAINSLKFCRKAIEKGIKKLITQSKHY